MRSHEEIRDDLSEKFDFAPEVEAADVGAVNGHCADLAVIRAGSKDGLALLPGDADKHCQSSMLDASENRMGGVDGVVAPKGHDKVWYPGVRLEGAAWSAPGARKVVGQTQIPRSGPTALAIL